VQQEAAYGYPGSTYTLTDDPTRDQKVHQPNNPAPEWKGKSHQGNYADAMMELDPQHWENMSKTLPETPMIGDVRATSGV
jgi:hypothetical protein